MSFPEGVMIHPLALVESDQIGVGTRIWAFAHVCRGAIIGQGCNLCDHTYVEGGATLGNGVTLKNQVAVWDGVTLEDDVFAGPNVTFTNVRVPRAFIKTPPDQFAKTVITRGATLGAGSVIVCGNRVGRYALVGAGAVVTHAVPDYGLVWGNPARLIGYVCKCGLRLGDDLTCTCGQIFQKNGEGILIPIEK
jgi:acetyltransferase-like isoleucine patch superfamily enzyme